MGMWLTFYWRRQWVATCPPEGASHLRLSTPRFLPETLWQDKWPTQILIRLWRICYGAGSLTFRLALKQFHCEFDSQAYICSLSLISLKNKKKIQLNWPLGGCCFAINSNNNVMSSTLAACLVGWANGTSLQISIINLSSYHFGMLKVCGCCAKLSRVAAAAH